MRRLEILNSVSRLNKTLEETGIYNAFKVIRRKPATKSDVGDLHKVLVPALNAFSIQASSFSGTEKFIMRCLGIEELLDVDVWSNWLSEEGFRKISISGILQGLHYSQDFLPRILKILKRDSDRLISTYTFGDTTGSELENSSHQESLTAILSEEDGHYSSPARVASLLSGVDSIYQVLAELQDVENQSIVLISCDSGSDKSFDFLGFASVIKEAKELILGLWDRVIFHREKHMEARFEMIASSLPVIERISELEKSGQMEREKAEILRRKIHEGVIDFLDAGAVIPEMKSNSNFSPRKLMTPAQKLLAPALDRLPEASKKEDLSAKDSSSSKQSLSPEEERQLLELLKRAQPGNNTGQDVDTEKDSDQ